MPHSLPDKSRFARRGAVAALAALLMLGAGCSPLVNFGANGPAANIFRLEPVAERIAGAPEAGWRLLVDKPTTIGSLDTNMVAVKTAPLEIRYYADVRWSDRLPDMIHSVLVDSFEQGTNAVALSDESAAGLAPYILETDIRDFQADVQRQNAPAAYVRLALKLTSSSPVALIASTTLDATAPAAGTDARELAAAFNAALADVLQQALAWTAAQVAAAGPAG